MLLRKKAAEELKKEQERKAAERRRIIEERCGKPKNVEDANEGIFNVKQNSRKVHSLDLFYHLTFICYDFKYFKLLFQIIIIFTIIPPPHFYILIIILRKLFINTQQDFYHKII